METKRGRFAFWRQGHRIRFKFTRTGLNPSLYVYDDMFTLKQALDLHAVLGLAIADLASWERENRKPDPAEIS